VHMLRPCAHKVASARANIYIDDIVDSLKGTHACIYSMSAYTTTSIFTIPRSL
jgi:hypothetical protein